jgi:hypothetical protein
MKSYKSFRVAFKPIWNFVLVRLRSREMIQTKKKDLYLISLLRYAIGSVSRRKGIDSGQDDSSGRASIRTSIVANPRCHCRTVVTGWIFRISPDSDSESGRRIRGQPDERRRLAFERSRFWTCSSWSQSWRGRRNVVQAHLVDHPWQ